MALISVSGKLNSGKDTVGNIIQYILIPNKGEYISFETYNEEALQKASNFEIKKFADKLKDIVCMILGCTRAQLEDRDFKEKELGKEWWVHKDSAGKIYKYDLQFPTYPHLPIIKLTPRLLLQLLGTDCGRDIIHPNVWVNSLMSEYKPNTTYRGEIWDFSPDGVKITDTGWRGEDKSSYPNWIITDTRFPNELQAVKDKGGISIRVNRHLKFPSLFEEPADDEHKPKPVEHPSETALDNAEFDYIIDNSGTIEELIEKVREILIKEQIL